jgi:hypothetical protein
MTLGTSLDSDSIASLVRGVYLPAELWAEVFSYLDDPFDVWVICRQVSSSLRKEAEIAFRWNFLPLLKMHWTLKSEQLRLFVVHAEYDTDTTDQSFTAASFQLKAISPLRYHGRSGFVSEMERKAMVFKALDYKDIDFQSRLEHTLNLVTRTPAHKLRMYFDTGPDVNIYMNDTDIPDMNVVFTTEDIKLQPPVRRIHSRLLRNEACFFGHTSFDWKALTDHFFAEEAFVRRQQVLQGRNATPHTNLAVMIVSVQQRLNAYDDGRGCKNNHPKLVEDEYLRDAKAQILPPLDSEKDLYATAYLRRLERSFASANLRIGFRHQVPLLAERVTNHVRWLRAARERQAVRLAKRGWAEEIVPMWEYERDFSEVEREGGNDDGVLYGEN